MNQIVEIIAAMDEWIFRDDFKTSCKHIRRRVKVIFDRRAVVELFIEREVRDVKRGRSFMS